MGKTKTIYSDDYVLLHRREDGSYFVNMLPGRDIYWDAEELIKQLAWEVSYAWRWAETLETQLRETGLSVRG